MTHASACPVCGVSLAGRADTARYCSRACKQKARRSRCEKVCCKHCGIMFTRSVGGGSRPRQYCSEPCRAAGYRKRDDQRWSDTRHRRATADVLRESAPTVYRALLAADPCAYCGAAADTLDHVTPRAHGGDDGADNLAAACMRCNSLKRAKPLLHFLIYRAVTDDIARLDHTRRILSDSLAPY